jgi:hypothetical protein
MSVVIESLRLPNRTRATYRVRCGGCNRTYITTQPRTNIERLRHCQGCVKRDRLGRRVRT